jgi:hypothetical protein
MGWKATFTSQRDRLPVLEFKCPFCKRDDVWVAHNGFGGVAPVPNCCPNATPYPMNDAGMVAHLSMKPKYPTDAQPRQPFIDTDEGGFSGDFQYSRWNGRR